MKRQLVSMLAVVALFVLGACTGSERTTLTGAYGSAVVTGEVTMGEGSSPAGVEVSVRGTGMSMVLAADGQFAFAGVPEEAELSFQRASDGIDATLRLQPAAGHVIVDLAQTAAKKGRRRAAGTKTHEIEGIIRSASAAEIVVDSSRQPGVVIALTPQTIIRHGNTVLTAADLVPGMRVHVKALKINEVLTATSIFVQNDGEDDDDDGEAPAVREYEGTVVSASATSLTIFGSKKKEETFVIDASTEIRKGNTPVPATDIQPGWRVHVKASAGADGTKTAVLVIVQRNK
ncbi:MAG: DUF5666 domain-containing protein [Acidobacteriota bacterium]|nr:DUF5666 domain-containing protein [Acidobacteriota bacterium]